METGRIADAEGWDAPDRPRVSALVLTFNEERHAGACLDALDWCDEIFVLDSFSKDRTPEIARARPNVRFHQREYFGAGPSRNWALPQLRHDWVLVFDADEICTPELRRELQRTILADPPQNAFTIHRRVYLLGRRIRFSGWRNDSVVRLWRKGTCRYQDRRVHAAAVPDGPAPRLAHSMDHHMADDWHGYVLRIVKYGRWGAAQAWRDGRRAGFFELFVRPVWRFVRTYVFQIGFLDGLLGLTFCSLQAYGTWVKYSTLWGWQVNAARGIEPDLPAFDDAAAGAGAGAGEREAAARRPSKDHATG